MVARKVTARLKPNALVKFSNLMECEVLPWLRAQEGFLDLITLAAHDGREMTTISFWDHPANAQAYNAGAYPEALTILGELLDGTPCVKTYQVVGSTLQAPAVERPSQAENLVRDNAPPQLGYGVYETGV